MFDHAACVSNILHANSHPLNRSALSYALWKQKRIVVVVIIAIFLAHNAACVYGECLSLPRSLGSPDAGSQP
jgi:hypothetical protein